jgi:hypothetical protein
MYSGDPPSLELTVILRVFTPLDSLKQALGGLHSSMNILPAAFFCLSLVGLCAQDSNPRAKALSVSSENGIMPPSVPLVACDPYFSIWSPGDKLTDVQTTHWTGKKQPLVSVVKVDGKTLRVLGAEPAGIGALPQTGLSVLPTRTVCEFAGEGISLTLTFTTPALPQDVALLSRPVTYLTYDFTATDGKDHDVTVCFAAGGEVAVNQTSQVVAWQPDAVEGLEVMRLGSVTQRVLGSKGDDHRIDWGYFYLAAPKEMAGHLAAGRPGDLVVNFAAGGRLGEVTGKGQAKDAGVGLTLKPLRLKAGQSSRQWLMVAYDDLYSIQYNHQNLRPYWRKGGWEAADLLKASAAEYAALQEKCAAFDAELQADMKAAGGTNFLKITNMAYRQCFAAGKFVADANGQPISFCKENHSNGCIATSDVFYPMAPQFLLFGPTLAKSFLVPFMEYAKSPRWKFPFAPHDLGTYPLANGQVYGGGERTEENQMPVEESGNMLILLAAVAQMEGNADFAWLYWERLTQWAGYLKEKGFDPDNQLCTDDFAGHLAHNVNLSVKAICGLGSFAKLCEMRGEKALAAEYAATAKQYAERWVKEAAAGDHTKLAFDQPNSWSQKYNLIWDKILGLKLFPEEVYRKEMDYYKKVQNTYGLPLDNRKDYTKLDWILWTATLTENAADFEALTTPVVRFIETTPDRSPLTDWYETKDAKKVGFTARPVIGGVFAKTLYDAKLWKKYASRDATRGQGWAAMPAYTPPLVKRVPASKEWSYSLKKPAAGWEKADFDAVGWQRGAGGFGSKGTPNATIGTEWTSSDIWLRRNIELKMAPTGNVQLELYHDEGCEIYLNGVLAAIMEGFVTDRVLVDISPEAKASLKAGANVLAIHCHQETGGQFVDGDLVEVMPGK